MNQERVVGVRLIDDPLHVGQGQGARGLLWQVLARTPIAAERLPLEQFPAVELQATFGLTERSLKRMDGAATRHRDAHGDGERDVAEPARPSGMPRPSL